MLRSRLLLAFVAVMLGCPAPSFGQNAHQLTFPPSGYSDAYIAFSPTGDRVAFARIQNGVAVLSTIFVTNLATGTVDSLVTDLPQHWSPSGGLEWSPDGKHICFIGDDPGVGSSVWIADVPAPPPSPLPHLVATVQGGSPGCAAIFAIDDKGTFYRDCGEGGQYQIAGSLPGRPVSLNNIPSSYVIWVGMENGDVYTTSTEGFPPYAFSFQANVFASAGITAVAVSAPRPQNHVASARPNPFNPVAKIPYTVASQGKVSVRVFDASGRLVRTIEDTSRVPGAYTAQWNGATDGGAPAASGTYFCQVHFADGSQQTRKVTLAR